jgi:hypothetical protein
VNQSVSEWQVQFEEDLNATASAPERRPLR